MEVTDSATESEYSPDTLAARLKNGPLPQNSAFEILSAIFSGIKKIHDAGFAPRDIKPDNILFIGGVPKLGDIGLLSSLTTTVTQIAGTMDFLPPELRTEDGFTSSDQLSRQRNDLLCYRRSSDSSCIVRFYECARCKKRAIRGSKSIGSKTSKTKGNIKSR